MSSPEISRSLDSIAGETLGLRMNAEAYRTLVQVPRVLKWKRRGALKKLKQPPVDMSQAIEAVGQAANEQKAAAMIALMQLTLVEVADSTSPTVAARESRPRPRSPPIRLPRSATRWPSAEPPPARPRPKMPASTR